MEWPDITKEPTYVMWLRVGQIGLIGHKILPPSYLISQALSDWQRREGVGVVPLQATLTLSKWFFCAET